MNTEWPESPERPITPCGPCSGHCYDAYIPIADQQTHLCNGVIGSCDERHQATLYSFVVNKFDCSISTFFIFVYKACTVVNVDC